MANEFDVIIVGGGLAGAALGKSLAENGIRVLVLEREISFRDRVRGEYMHPWGVTEAKALGLYELLKLKCGYEARFRAVHISGQPESPPRDLITTSPHKIGSLHFYHPEMQEAVLGAAGQAGAVVERGATVVEVSPGDTPSVRIRAGESEHTYRARLVVGAEGRTSLCRKWMNFTVNHDRDRMMIAGVLFTNMDAPEEAVNTFIDPGGSQFAFAVPLGNRRFRCYAGFYQQEGRRPLSGVKAASEFVVGSIATGMPAEWFAKAEVAGPLASFNCADTWIDHPYREGVALVGDAAAVSDPSFGCGLSLVLLDARVLSNLLITNDDWHAAAHSYADEHDRYFGCIHRLLDWMTKLYYEPGPIAAERRARAFERIAEDPKRSPDIPGLGPESPSDEMAYMNLFGDDELA